MKLISILDQQQHDEILKLEIAYSNLLKAYASSRREEMIGAIAATLISNPNHIIALKNGIDKVFTRQYGHNFLRNINWCFISDEDLKLNVEGCLNAIRETFSKNNFYKNNYIYTQSVLYRDSYTFQQEEVLYHNAKGEQLRVVDFLSVLKYAINIAEAIDPSNDEYAKANAAITVFQGIDAILNNKSDGKQVNKMLHLATSFISSVVKSSIKNDEGKRGVMITTMMVDLVIDFFTKSRND